MGGEQKTASTESPFLQKKWKTQKKKKRSTGLNTPSTRAGEAKHKKKRAKNLPKAHREKVLEARKQHLRPVLETPKRKKKKSKGERAFETVPHNRTKVETEKERTQKSGTWHILDGDNPKNWVVSARPEGCGDRGRVQVAFITTELDGESGISPPLWL